MLSSQSELLDSVSKIDDKCEETLEFYKLMCLLLSGISSVLSVSICIIYCMMRRQINQLLKVHEFGNIPLELMTDADGNLATDRSEGKNIVAIRQQSRDAIVRIIKF